MAGALTLASSSRVWCAFGLALAFLLACWFGCLVDSCESCLSFGLLVCLVFSLLVSGLVCFCVLLVLLVLVVPPVRFVLLVLLVLGRSRLFSGVLRCPSRCRSVFHVKFS